MILFIIVLNKLIAKLELKLLLNFVKTFFSKLIQILPIEKNLFIEYDTWKDTSLLCQAQISAECMIAIKNFTRKMF
jgi:hypothetical protein